MLPERKTGAARIRLEDIYRHLEQRYPNASELMQAEIAMECNVCYPNGEMTALFQYACENKTSGFNLGYVSEQTGH